MTKASYRTAPELRNAQRERRRPASAATVTDQKAVDIYDIRRPERAIAGFHTFILYIYYGWVTQLPFAFVFDAAQAIFDLAHRPALAFLLDLRGIVAVTIVFLFSYYIYGGALMKLPRSGCAIASAVSLALLSVEVIYFMVQSQTHSGTSLFISAAAAIWLLLVTVALAHSWIRLTLASRRDRYLMRSPFEKVTEKSMLQFVAGIPPIANFAPRGWPQVLFYVSNLCLALAITNQLGAIVLVEQRNVLAQLASGLEVVVATLILVSLANRLRSLAQSKIRFSVDSLTASDQRAPILFLRAFRDDLVTLPPYNYLLMSKIINDYSRARTLDHILLEEGTLYGPVVALGNPKDPIPPYGVARQYVNDVDWQTSIKRLSQDAKGVVLCVDDTEAVWWEIEHLAETLIAKVLFIVHPKFRGLKENRRITSSLIERIPQLRNNPDIAQSLTRGDVVGFFLDPSSRLHVGRSGLFSHYGYLLVVRWFLRLQFGLVASPPR